MSRAVVIGAGVGGLAVAARLAANGHRVRLFEATGELGGKLGRYTREGFTFDTGPSLLALPEVFTELFAATGEPLDHLLRLDRLDPLARYRFADGTWVTVPAGAQARREALDAALGPGAGRAWEDLLDHGRHLWEVARAPFLSSPLAGPADLARLALTRPGDLRAVARGRTLSGLSRCLLDDVRLQVMAQRYATYTGSDPRRCPAVLALIAYVEAAYGAWYIPGGLYELAGALARRCRDLGVEIVTHAPVTAVEHDGRRVRGVRVGGRAGAGELIPADLVVSDADATRVLRDLLTPARPRAIRGALRRLARATPSLSGFVLLLGVRGRTPGLAHHTVSFPADYTAEFDAIFGPRPQPVADPALYVCAPDDPAGAPDGDEAWFVLANAPRQGPVDWTAPGLAAAYARHLLDVLAARGLDVRHRLAFAEYRSPAELERATGAPGGAIYGTSSNGLAAAFLRPANRTGLAGLYLVGGSAHPGGGLPLVALSARIVATLVGPA